MAVFIDLWPYLFNTKLSYTQLFKWGHSTVYLEYWKTSNMSAAPPWWVHSLWIFLLFNTVPILLVLLLQRLRSPKLGVNSQPTSACYILPAFIWYLVTLFFVFIVLNQIMMKKNHIGLAKLFLVMYLAGDFRSCSYFNNYQWLIRYLISS